MSKYNIIKKINFLDKGCYFNFLVYKNNIANLHKFGSNIK